MCQTLEELRQAEIDLVRPWFPPGSRVLELGGGSGYQASVIASWGCQVLSVDIPGRPPQDVSHYPVQDYDGVHLPFADGQFDIVFSSNVLEHVPAVDSLLHETHRVLAPSGIALHLMPSTAWRWWTCATHYPYIVSRLTRLPVRVDQAASLSVSEKALRRGWIHVVRRAVLPAAHGEYPSALAELYYFSRHRWRGVFARAGFRLEAAQGHGLFYTGYGIWPGLGLPARRRIARWLGSGCNLFIAAKA